MLFDAGADSIEDTVDSKIEGARGVFGEYARIKGLQQSRVAARFRLEHMSQVVGPLLGGFTVFSYLLECGVPAYLADEGKKSRVSVCGRQAGLGQQCAARV